MLAGISILGRMQHLRELPGGTRFQRLNEAQALGLAVGPGFGLDAGPALPPLEILRRRKRVIFNNRVITTPAPDIKTKGLTA